MKKLALLSLAFLTIFALVSALPAAAEEGGQAADLATLTELEALLAGSSVAASTPAQPDLQTLLSDPAGNRIEVACVWLPTGDCCGPGNMLYEWSCNPAITRCAGNC
jgi:hypothetical protein